MAKYIIYIRGLNLKYYTKRENKNTKKNPKEKPLVPSKRQRKGEIVVQIKPARTQTQNKPPNHPASPPPE